MWIDTHCHTKYSYDNWLEPLALIRRAKALGLDGVVVTEHHSFFNAMYVGASTTHGVFDGYDGEDISLDRTRDGIFEIIGIGVVTRMESSPPEQVIPTVPIFLLHSAR